MYNSPYGSIYKPQASIDRINNQIAELEKMKQQIPQAPAPTNLTQNFQLAPTNQNVIKYANSIEEVQKAMIIGDTPFFSENMSVVWLKNTRGDIKTYELKEIIPLDEKDIKIEYLQEQIKELKGIINNEYDVTNNDAELIETSTTEDDGAIRTTTKEIESTSISRVPKRKKK